MINTFTTREEFWSLSDITKTQEQWRISHKLSRLSYLSLEQLQNIFIQYRYFTHYYITDLAILISRLPLGNLRSILADILSEELGNGVSDKAHPILYDNFLRSIGVKNHQLDQANAQCISILADIQKLMYEKSSGYAVGLRGMGGECLCQIYLSTLYEYFTLNPAIQELNEQIDWTFWMIHTGDVDLEHQRLVREAIDELIIREPNSLKDILHGYLESKNAWDNYWMNIFNSVNEAVYYVNFK